MKNTAPRMTKLQRWLPIALMVIIADRAAKLAAPHLRGAIPLIPGVIGLRYAENTGMAFSLFSGMPWLLGLLSLAVIVGGYFLLRKYRLGTLSMTAAMLMLGGAVANMIDRLVLGYVVDMLEFLFIRFPIFNVADACLVIGAMLMAWSLLRHPEEWHANAA